MPIQKISICAGLLLLAMNLAAQDVPAQPVSNKRVYTAGGLELEYQKPAFWATIANGPKDWWTFAKNSFSKESLPWLGAITASTLILIEYDQKLYSNAQRVGKKLSISTKDKTKPFIVIGGVPLLRGPTDLGSAMYFLGDGWVNIGLCGYFEAYGLIKDDWRALTTGHQLIEGLLVTGFTTQLLKRSTGRETPRAASAPRGVWRFFPSFSDFAGHRTRYDAFPSGHLATGMMTVTVIADNYPEKKFVKPLGYALLGALSFQMVNNGVHWASDYPLGLGIGYAVGKAITGNAGKRRQSTAGGWRVLPEVVPGERLGLNLAYSF